MTHEQEILASRVGGLGGSDAAMVLKIGQKGIDALSHTDKVRLAVMKGIIQPEEKPCTAAMNAGHLFEDWVANLDIMKNAQGKIEREKFISGGDVNGVNVFAHSDFVLNDMDVVECKYSQKDTDSVVDTYYAQLQWYYMLGAKTVHLFHGWGSVEPFEVEESRLLLIDKNEDVIADLQGGLLEISEYLRKNDLCAEFNDRSSILPYEYEVVMQEATTALEQIDKAQKLVDIARKKIFEYMFDNNIRKIECGGWTATIVDGSVRKTFDSKKAIQLHPELDNSDMWKLTDVKPSLKISKK